MKKLFLALLSLGLLAPAQDVPMRDNSPTKYKFAPATAPRKTGEIIVAIVPIIFKETELKDSIDVFKTNINTIDGKTMQEYFKIYSNNIVWPKMLILPEENIAAFYVDTNFYGYYCPYEFWDNPIGYEDKDEGAQRVSELKERALKHVKSQSKISQWDALSFNYITTQKSETALKELLTPIYTTRTQGIKDKKLLRKLKREREREKKGGKQYAENEVWKNYSPGPAWGDPIWPNSSIQMNNADSGTFAHELGHVLGAPDVYRIGAMNDGIGGTATAISYGPTANAFSRFYHHGFISAKNYKMVTAPGSYTLNPRHLNPKGDETLGIIIPSNHPHYFYHVEYVYDGGSEPRCGGDNPEGMLISVVNFNLQSYLGSPDYFYTYRPNDPYFRGEGNYNGAIFGEKYDKTEFSLETNPSCLLPNLIDGGIRITNIKEQQGTLSFDLAIERKKTAGAEYQQSLLPQIELKEPKLIQPTRFVMDAVTKFRGEPCKIDYGFCWGTNRNPTIKDNHYILSHREFYSGHAVGLKPEATYYVRAWTRNALGVRYSDEEFTVKTPALNSPSESVEPLLLDQFSHNWLLVKSFSNDDYQNMDGYTSTAVLGKLIAYYRPVKLEKDITKETTSKEERKTKKDKKDEGFKFGLINWSPSLGQIAWRQNASRQLFSYCYKNAGEAKMKEPKPAKSILRDLAKALKVTAKPVLTACKPENKSQIEKLLKQELHMSRPVLLFYYNMSEGDPSEMQWALIDGYNAQGQFHVDIPSNSVLSEIKSGYFTYEEFQYPNWQANIITNIQLLK